FIKESTGETQRIVRNAKKRFDSEWKPKLNVVGEKFSEKWRDLKDYTQKSGLKEKMETMRDTVSKVRESIVSFVEDLKVFGQEWFMDDDFSWPMAKKEDIKESLEVQLVKEDNSWYIRRGKDREFIRNQGDGRWPLGRVVGVYLGHDGLIRSVEVKLPNQRVYHRPITKLLWCYQVKIVVLVERPM
ncbi:Uncharacterized protein FKW44_020203, partial [Caligus rogercresseyi]